MQVFLYSLHFRIKIKIYNCIYITSIKEQRIQKSISPSKTTIKVKKKKKLPYTLSQKITPISKIAYFSPEKKSYKKPYSRGEKRERKCPRSCNPLTSQDGNELPLPGRAIAGEMDGREQ